MEAMRLRDIASRWRTSQPPSFGEVEYERHRGNLST